MYTMSVGIRAKNRAPILHLVKSAIATVAAWLITGWLLVGTPPVLAAVAALLVVQPSVNQSLAKAIERSVGVITGVLIATAAGTVFGNQDWVVVAAVVAALIVGWALRMTPGTASQIAVSALLVLAFASSAPGYAADRVIETLIGAVIGMIVNVVIVPPIPMTPARNAVDALVDQLASALDRLADACDRPQTRPELDALLEQARRIRAVRDAADAAIVAAAESLTFNPRAGRHRFDLARLRTTLDGLTPIVTQVIGMTRAFTDRYEPTVAADPAMREVAASVRRAAGDLRHVVGDAERAASDVSARSGAPRETTVPQTSHWVLVGSMLEDYRRVDEELLELRSTLQSAR